MSVSMPRIPRFDLRILRDAGIVPTVSQTAGEMPTLISLVDSGMGIAILPHRRSNIVSLR